VRLQGIRLNFVQMETPAAEYVHSELLI